MRAGVVDAEMPAGSLLVWDARCGMAAARIGPRTDFALPST